MGPDLVGASGGDGKNKRVGIDPCEALMRKLK